MNIRPILFGSTGLALLFGGVAFAMPQVPIIPLDVKAGQTYVTIDAQYSGVPDQDLDFYDTCPFGEDGGENNADMLKGKGRQHCAWEDKTPFLDAAKSIDAYGGGGIIGVGANPWFGQGQRFELGFAVLNGNGTTHREEFFHNDDYDDNQQNSVFRGKGCNTDGYSINTPQNCNRPRHIGIEATAKTDYDAFNIVARTLVDFEVSRLITITPNFGFVYRHTENETHALASWIDEEQVTEVDVKSFSGGGGRGFNKWLPERNDLIRTNELGVELGTTISLNLSDSFKLFGGVNGEVLYREGRLNRTDSKNGGYGGGCNEYPGGGAGFSSNSCDNNPCAALCIAGPVMEGGGYGKEKRFRDSLNDTAVNVTLSLGASWRFKGGTTLSVIGYAQNEDYLVVKNDKYEHDNDPAFTTTESRGRNGGRGAHLESERDWTPGVVVALTVPFGG